MTTKCKFTKLDIYSSLYYYGFVFELFKNVWGIYEKNFYVYASHFSF